MKRYIFLVSCDETIEKKIDSNQFFTSIYFLTPILKLQVVLKKIMASWAIHESPGRNEELSMWHKKYRSCTSKSTN